MDYKKTKAPTNTVTRDIMNLCEETGNIYESVAIIGKRANQISADIKQELNQKLQEFATTSDSLEEVFENREQIEISRGTGILRDWCDCKRTRHSVPHRRGTGILSCAD